LQAFEELGRGAHNLWTSFGFGLSKPKLSTAPRTEAKTGITSFDGQSFPSNNVDVGGPA